MRSLRRRARESALQILYEIDANNLPAAELNKVLSNYWAHLSDPAPADLQGYTDTIARGVTTNQENIDQRIRDCSHHWKLERMSRVDRTILRIGVFELTALEEPLPAGVVINEAVELAKRFGAVESPAFVNGILDRIAKSGA